MSTNILKDLKIKFFHNYLTISLKWEICSENELNTLKKKSSRYR